MKKYLMGIDVGGTTVKIGQFDLEGKLLGKWDLPTDRSDRGSHILEQIHASLAERLDLEEVKGIGFGVPGPVSEGIVFNCVNLGWGSTNVEQEFRRYLKNPDIQVKVSNDANVAAAGEVFQGAAKGYRNVCLFTLGTGVGGGIIVDGKLVDGVNGIGGELGHLLVDRAGRFSCNCGKKGCLETVASATGIVNLAKLHMAQDPTSLLHKFETFSAKRVFDLAKAGDRAALKAVDEAADYLAYAASLVTLVNNPEIFVFGGGVSAAGQFLLDLIEKHYPDYVRPFLQKGHFALASLGNDAGMYGAAFLVR
jgi:glucokinase